MSTLATRVVLISGGTSGIGLATAEALLAAGARVIVCGRKLDRVAALRDRIADPQRLATLVLDVDDAESVASLPDRVPSDWPAVDTLIASAGHDVGGRRPFHECDADQMTNIIETNVNGMIRLVRAFITTLRASPQGHIVTLGSTAGLRPTPGYTAYTTSKFGVRAFTEQLRTDYKTEALRVTEILPGLVETGFAEARLAGDKAAAAAYYSGASGCLTSGDIADAILYALSAPLHVNVAQLLIVPTRDK